MRPWHSSAVDLSGRGYAVIDASMGESDLGGLSGSLIHHFLESFALEGKFNLHVRLLSGANNHHKAEAIFKALARAMRDRRRARRAQDEQRPEHEGRDRITVRSPSDF